MKRIIEKSVSTKSNSSVQTPHVSTPFADMALVSTVGVGDARVVRASNERQQQRTGYRRGRCHGHLHGEFDVRRVVREKNGVIRCEAALLALWSRGASRISREGKHET